MMMVMVEDFDIRKEMGLGNMQTAEVYMEK
jgi:hypothetical protein